MAERVLALLSNRGVRAALGVGSDAIGTDTELAEALANLGSAQGRLHALDDDYYVHGLLAESRYRPIKAKLEREVDR